FGEFQLLDAATCPPAGSGLTAAQTRAIVLRAIKVAIGIANEAASRLEIIEEKRKQKQPRDANDKDIARLFLFFFRHDPDLPIPWAGNQASGANVAYRLRKVAKELVDRGMHYRCACPGAPATRRGQSAPGALDIELCNAFWNVPGGL